MSGTLVGEHVARRDEGRTANMAKRRFYSRYMRWLERIGYAVVLFVIGAFVYAFTARVDDVISADGVELAAAFAPIEATNRTLVVRQIAAPGTEVAKDAPVLEIVEGDLAIAAFHRWEAASLLGDPALLARNPRPATRVLTAPRAGELGPAVGAPTPDAPFVPQTFEAKVEIARVTDFNEIHAAASLAGDTSASAHAGGEARITNLAFPNPDGVAFRATTGVDGPAIASRDLLGPELRIEIEKALVGSAVRLKGDTLKIKKVSDVQVDGKLSTAPGNGGEPLDLAGGAVLRGRVLTGSPVATAQLIDLPGPLADLVRQRVASLAGKDVTTPDGTSLRIVGADGAGVLIKIKADGLADAGASVLSATPLKTTFDADVQIDAPSPSLVRAVRDAARAGKPVTARVEFVTGTRPLAFLLLKRS